MARNAAGHFQKMMAAIFYCCWCTMANAGPADNWHARVWQTEDGLPAANVTGIAQTQDGYLWLATQAGLARFDGAQFEEIPVPLGRAKPLIRAMFCDHAENFWLAEDAGVLVRMGNGGAKMFTATNGLPDALPLQMVETLDHSVWISYADGSVHRSQPDDTVTRITAAAGMNEDGVCSLTVDARGVLWYAKGAQFGFFTNAIFQKAGTLSDRNPQILGAHNGSSWLATSTLLLKTEPNGAPVRLANFGAEATRVKPTVMFEDATGRLWIGTAADGLFVLEHTNFFRVATSQNNIHALARDREGNVWVGTDGGGLNRLRQRAVELRGREEGLPFETVRSLASSSTGELWVVTQDGALTILHDNDWSRAQKVENWPGGQAHCVAAGRNGVMWIATYQRGLYCWTNGGFARYTTNDGLGGMTVRSLLVDSRDDLWIGVETGHRVQRLHGGVFQSFDLPADCRAVRAMAEDTAGRIWLGTIDGRLFSLAADKLSEVAQGPGGTLHPIRCVCATADGDIWVGYAVNGVCRVHDGQLAHIGREDGLFDANICAVMPDDNGRMWFASDRGIFYANLAELDDFTARKSGRVQSIFFGRDAGLPSLQAYYGYWPGALRQADGEILFPTHSGIAVVHPRSVHANVIPPNVSIQRALVDGRQVADEADNRAADFPPGHRRVEFIFTAPSFVAPEQVRFRYKLEGWNEEWSEPAAARSAIFSRLPPGNYTFRVTACNNFGVWNNVGDALAFTVRPFFWQSWWFRFFAVLAFAGAVAAVVRYFSLRRVRMILRTVEQQTALLKERTRIAQDMHDELGARFTQISLLGDLSSKAVAEPDKAREFLDQISRAAQSGVKSLDEIVWAVNPRNDSLPDLLAYTGQYARDFLAFAGITCRLDFPDDIPALEIPGDIRHAVFLIIKEALNNVVKHAGATRVKIIFELERAELRWLIEDDGKGFEAAPENALADGLRNFQQRAAAIGGSVEIKSRVGAGTRVTLKIPLPK